MKTLLTALILLVSTPSLAGNVFVKGTLIKDAETGTRTLNGIEVWNCVKVGVHGGQVVYHVLTNDQAKIAAWVADGGYISRKYKDMPEAIADEVIVVEQEVDEWDDEAQAVIKKVKRKKRKQWKDEGNPATRLREVIPHHYFGVPVE